MKWLLPTLDAIRTSTYAHRSPHLKDECIEEKNGNCNGMAKRMQCALHLWQTNVSFFISAKRLKSVHNTAHRVSMHMYLKSHLIGILKCFKWLISLLQPNIHRHIHEKKMQSLLFMNKWTELIAHWASAHKNYFLKNLNSFRMNMKRKEKKTLLWNVDYSMKIVYWWIGRHGLWTVIKCEKILANWMNEWLKKIIVQNLAHRQWLEFWYISNTKYFTKMPE